MILVMAAGGAVSSSLLGELHAAGHTVRAAYHSPRATHDAIDAGHDAVTVDCSQPATLPAAVEGVESVFLLGAMGPDQTRQELNVVRAAEAAAVCRVVKLSVWRADERLTPIARLHRPVEEALEASSLSWTFLRPNFYMQNFARQMAGPIKTTGTFSQPASSAAISFVDIRDVARVAKRVLTTDGHDEQIYDITGPQGLTYEAAADTLSRVLDDIPVRYVALDDDEARAGMLRSGLPDFHADALIEVSRAYRDGGAGSVTSAVDDLTGRNPISFEQFVDDRAAFA